MDEIGHIQSTVFVNFSYCGASNPGSLQGRGRPLSANKRKATFFQAPSNYYRARFVPSRHAQEDISTHRYGKLRAVLGFEECRPELQIYPHHLSRGFHLRTQEHIHAGEFYEWKYRFFDAHMSRSNLFGEADFAERFSGHYSGADLCQWHADCLGDEWDGPGRPRIDFQHEDLAVLQSKLEVHQPLDLQLHGQHAGHPADLVQVVASQAVRGEGA